MTGCGHIRRWTCKFYFGRRCVLQRTRKRPFFICHGEGEISGRCNLSFFIIGFFVMSINLPRLGFVCPISGAVFPVVSQYAYSGKIFIMASISSIRAMTRL